MSSESFGDPSTRQRILEAAWKLVEERDDVRLVDVAERAGVSRQAVYLHFGDRAGLLTALVLFMDEALGVEGMAVRVFEAPDGVEMLERVVDLNAVLAPRIDRVAQVLESGQHRDAALRAAWRNRLDNRRSIHRSIVQRIADEGRLAEGWTVDAASDLFHAVMLPGTWRELTKEVGWTADQYRAYVTRLLRRSLIADPPSTLRRS